MTTQTANQELSTFNAKSNEHVVFVRAAIQQARCAQKKWAEVTVTERLKTIRNVRHLVAEHSERLARSVTFQHRNSSAETIAAEIIPIADACKFLEAEANKVLATQRLGRRLRPKWLGGIDTEIHRDPFGVVLIIGAANYPLFLSGIQCLQALTAGNAVLVKPGLGARQATETLRDLVISAGIDSDLIHVLPEGVEYASAAIDEGVDKVFLTGSAETGRKVQSALAHSLTPSAMELSGCDAVFVLESADLERVARCLVFGLRFNNSATCIAPRRVFVPANLQSDLIERISQAVSTCAPAPTCSNDAPGWRRAADLIDAAVTDGANLAIGKTEGNPGQKSLSGWTVLSDARPEMTLLKTDIFAPVISIVPIPSQPTTYEDAALAANEVCPYALGATVFGAPDSAKRLARRINAGCVVINDMIAPTADPRIPFGGRRQSGFGVTRGKDGLLEMTQTKAVLNQRAKWLPHLDDPTPYDAPLLAGFLKFTHGKKLGQRMSGLKALVQSAMAQRTWQREQKSNAGANDAHK